MSRRWTSWSGLLGVVALLSPLSARGQQIEPYVMLLFDTSGSMAWRVCDSSGVSGDNTAECPGNDVSCSTCNTLGCGDGIPNDIRLYKVKKGMYDVVSAFGEVTFGLSRFHQDPKSFACSSGGWDGIGSCGTVNMGTGGNRADVLVSFSDNNQDQILRWMNNCDDYPTVGACTYGTNPGSGTPSTGCNLCADCGGGCDLELRAEGNTPLAGSLYTLHNSFFPAVLAADAKADCRPYKVIVLSDGQDNCAGNPNTEAGVLYAGLPYGGGKTKSIPVHVVGFGSSSLATALNGIANAGGTNQAIIVDNEVSLALAMAQIVSESILKESCNNADDDCDDLCDEEWPEVAVSNPACTNQRAAQTCTVGLGICARSSTYVCKADGSGSECNVSPGPPAPGGEICNNGLDDDCDGAVDEGCLPCAAQPEVCDGKDNDCDGQIDEDYASVPCGSDIGECKQGTTSCVNGKVVCNGATPPTTELCDNKDNNCDTIVDMFAEACYPPGNGNGCDTVAGTCQGICQLGSTLCTNGSWGACFGYQGPLTEACNGLDDDCDGQTDEGVLNTCTDFATCTTYTTCSACPQTPLEICDNKDNDCNGQVDDNPLYVGDPCGAPLGECSKGTYVCKNGQLVCEGGTGPTPEICDGKDNDCNGAIDDNVPGEGDPCGTSVGECSPGVKKCLGGQWICVGGTQPSPEICDGKDNDCDGETDEMAECPGASVCVNGQCLLPCTPGEFTCPGGTKCKDGYCQPDACNQVTCKETERCVDGKCIDKCSGVVCSDHEKCDPKTGQCVDDSCVTKGCPSGESCVDYTCVPNPCPPGKCPDGQMCIDGKCYDTCANVTCPKGQVCSQGVCTSDPCAGITCPSNHTCKVVDGKGQCVPDPCRLVSCSQGEICHDGNCLPDPCKSTACPEGFECRVNHSGLADCELAGQAAITNQLLASGSGGCSCDVGGSDGGGAAAVLLLLLLGGLALVRTRD